MAEQDIPPPTITAMKIPIIRKGEYDIWSMRMRQYICHTDHNLWDVIVNGDLEEEPAPTGETSAPPAPKTAKQLAAKRNQERVKSILLLAIPDEYLLKFHNVADAKSLWEAIKSRFGGNEESKKMQKNVLKHQFENFSTASNESLDKAYDRFQKLISQLEVHGAPISKEDINQKFLRSLPPSWNQIALIMRNKPDIDEIDIDDLYNNLRVYEDEMKRSSSSTSTSQNLAFLSSENTSSTNEVSTASGDFGVSTAGGISQIDEDDLKELDLRWQVAMLTVRVRKFIQKTGRNMDFKEKRHVSLDKSKIECYNCHRKGHFARECRSGRNQGKRSYGDNGRSNAPTNESSSQALVAQDGLGGYDWSNDFYWISQLVLEPRGSDLGLLSSQAASEGSRHFTNLTSKHMDWFTAGYGESNAPTNESSSQALVAQDGLVSYDWSNDFEVEPVNYALMAISSSSSSSVLHDYEKVVKERDELKLKIEKWEESSKNLDELLNSQMSARDKTGLGYGTQLNEMSNNSETNSEISLSVFVSRTRNFLTPRADISFAGKTNEANTQKPKTIYESVNRDKVIIEDWNSDDEDDVSEVQTVSPVKTNETQTVKTRVDKIGVLTRTGLITPVKQNEKRAVHTVSTARPVSTVRPRPKGNYLDHVSKDSGSFMLKKGNPEILLQDHAVVDSGCSSHMSAKSKILNNVRYITAKVAGKPVNISEASIRSDLLFDDADGIDSLHNQAIFDAIKGYQGDLTILTFNKALFLPQWRFLFHTMNHCISSKSTSWDQIPTNIATSVICLATNQKYNFSKLIFDGMMRHLDAKKKFVMYPRFISGKKNSGNVTPLFPSMLAQPTEDEGTVSERPSETQPTPSHPHPSADQHKTQPDPSPRPSPTIPIHDSILEGFGGNHGAAQIKDLKSQIKQLKKKAKPVITHHNAWMKSVSMKQRLTRKKSLKKKWMKKESVSKQERKLAKSEPTVHKDPAFDEVFDDVDVNDAMDYMETDAYMQKGVSTEDQVSTVKPDEGTDKPKVSTDKPEVSTAKPKEVEVSTNKLDEGTAKPKDGTSDESTAPTTVFRDDETIAEFLVSMSQNKAKQKGVEIKDAEDSDRPRATSTRSVLTLKPLPKIDPKDKGKKVLEEEAESDAESEGVDEAERKFDQLAKDEEIARKVQEDWEAEEEMKKLAEEEATKAALIQDFDDIQARIEADRLLAARLQEEERETFTVEERAKFLYDTIAAQRRFLAQQRAAAIRSRPPTRTQLRNQMMTYLKHVGGKKHADLKNKNFEEIQVLYKKVKRSDKDFIAIGSAEDERQIKEMNEESKDPKKKRLKKRVVNETPREEDTAKVPAEQEVTEQGTKKRKSGHVKMIARKRPRPQPDDDSDDEHRKCLRIVTFDSTIDSEIMETKSFVSKLHKVSSPDGDYLVVYRVNGHFRAFNYLMEVLHIFDRQDLFHLYDLVMKQYSEITPEGIELILWGDLKIMMESSTEENDQGDFWNNQQDWEIVSWRLYEACGVCILELKDGTVIYMLVERRYPLS
ncbi:ribonuclease H-like domain-containing protein [Tanacetum coccineum]